MMVEKTHLFLRIISGESGVLFRSASEVSATVPQLEAEGYVVMTFRAARVRAIEDLYRECAIAFRKPANWYGFEEYAPNANAFLEYFDDVAEWRPGAGHVLIVEDADEMFRRTFETAGHFVELCLFARGRGSSVRTVFLKGRLTRA